MEKQNENMSSTQGSDVTKLTNMFSNYQRRQKEALKSATNGKNLLPKYFVPRNNKEIFRILPPKDNKQIIEEAYFHVVPTNGKDGKVKRGTVIYCPAHNDPKVPKLDNNGNIVNDPITGKPIMVPAPCPLCAKHKKMMSLQDNSIKYVKKENMTPEQEEIRQKNSKIFADANVWDAKRFYIVRGIDKGVEKDGVKFWRFKHNFKNQGTLDKLLPILQEYYENLQLNPTSAEEGTDLSITMTDTILNGRTYKTISAITYKGKSVLHSDPLIKRQWLDDPITWRDVFLPKKVSNIVTPYEYLQLVATGNSPYWDDTDANNKHWVFPGRPDLEEKANTRTRNLDADEDNNFEYASDVTDNDGNKISISNVNSNNVGTYQDDALDMGKSVLEAPTQTKTTIPSTPVKEVVEEEGETPDTSEEDYNDLPF
jgi:hypothetical protein